MLSRAAENIFWLARNIERAEANARLLEMGRRMTMLPGSSGRNEWRSVLRASGTMNYLAADEIVSEENAVNTLLLDQQNHSSIRSSLVLARNNAKAVRTAMTQQMWETLNTGWRDLDGVTPAKASDNLENIIESVMMRTATFRGAAESSMLRNDRYDFLRIGWFIERIDNTLRLLDVKYYILLPESDVVGGGRDYHQWTSLLSAVSAMRAFYHAYENDYAPWRIADFLILNESFPRSIKFCMRQISHHLNLLGERYGHKRDCQDTAERVLAKLCEQETGEIFQSGLHEFLTGLMSANARLSREIAASYNFTG
ncbi:alpha-E domain-containing protein [Parvularcula sp. IMCC14364]|uniref:alpha-E domain-containing protein n=1 Tax=Parvularcula sp. IMCC14364 TaxID=3067902 RepID=UPI0027403B41|nr:alpha-E domain-containing protein [Parvularcula sp. IMCC14364]